MKRTKIILLILLFPVLLFAQERTITGKVTENSGEGIPGVSIVIKGTSSGTITNVDGDYSISKISENTTLVFSFVGLKTQEISVGNQTSISITMVEDAIGIEEIIAVGYGTQKKGSLTGAISSITSDEITATKGQNVQNMLTGRLPGVRVVQRNSEPGNFDNSFDIRGFGSPLVIIDGVPRGDLQRLDPSEIESVSVLKDASAAVYGVRAANGVVLVTTKKGEKGAPKLSYSMFYGMQYPAELLKPIGAVDRMSLFNERTMRSTSNPQITYGEEEFEAYRTGAKQSSDWYGAVLRDNAPQQQHNFNLSGGSENVSYFVNLGYANQEGFWNSDDLNYNRFNLRANIEAKVSKRLTFGLKLNGIMDKRSGPRESTRSVFKSLWRSVPNEPIYANDNPDYLQLPASDIENPVGLMSADLSGFNERQNRIFQSTMDLKYDIPGVKGLTAKGLFSYDTRMSDNSAFRKTYQEYNYSLATETYTGVKKGTPTKMERYYGINQNILYQVSLNYDRSFNDVHNLNVLALFEGAHSEGDNLVAEREFSIDFPYLFAGNSLNQVGTANPNGINEYASNGFVGKLNYDYKGKYLVEFSFRYDGSSKFQEDNRWGFFPGGSVGWRISEESFIKDNFAFIDNLKLRASYGQMGDDGALDYQFLSGYDYPNTSGGRRNAYPTGYMFGGTFINALGFRAAANPNITWFTVNTMDIGIDGDFWRGKLGFTADYFERERDGLLANRLVSLPGTFGAIMPQENLNSDFTNGFEIELRHRNQINDFRYNVSGNFSLTRPRMSYKEQSPFGNSYDQWRNSDNDRYKDIWFGYSDGGRYTSYEEIANSDVFTSISTLPGDYKYEDWNGDGIIDGNDNHPIARKNNPLINFGLNLAADYKGFDLSMLFQGASMSYVVMNEALRQPLMWDGNALYYFMDRWHTEDPTLDPYDPNNTWNEGLFAYGGKTSDADSEYSMQDGTYVRLKSIELGYTIPKTVLNKVNIGNVRVFINAYNLLTFTKVYAVDPEKPDAENGYMYPLNKTVNLGAKITF